jgi:AraC family transcriptional regulator of adaptative response/methylated-DNA-[protein]-cysteine methyltransferase
MIAGATEQGVCFLEWRNRGGVSAILSRVAKRYRTTPLKEGNKNPHLEQLRAELADYFAGRLRDFQVKIDVAGTPFQQRVWRQLLSIPYGKIRSYTQLAAAVGQPTAVRAVGRANGANYLSIVIPCHRVIKSDGGLGGYGGKVWRKKRLLELEGSAGQYDL